MFSIEIEKGRLYYTEGPFRLGQNYAYKPSRSADKRTGKNNI
jgi:hypothetical protein